MRILPLLFLLLTACPGSGTLAGPDDDDSEDITPPPEETPSSWMYSGVVEGTDDLVDVFVGDDWTTSSLKGTWSLESTAGPEARVDVLHGTTQAQTFMDCGRQHTARFSDPSSGPPPATAELSVIVLGAPSAEAVTGVFFVGDALNPQLSFLSQWDLEPEGDGALLLERTVGTGEAWRLHLWTLVDGVLSAEAEMSGGPLGAGEFVEGEITLTERDFDTITVVGEPPADAVSMSLTEFLPAGTNNSYGATVYKGPIALSAPLPRLSADAQLSVAFTLEGSEACPNATTTASLTDELGTAQLGAFVEPPGLLPALGYWTTTPELELYLPDGADQGYASMYGSNGYQTTWWGMNLRPGCVEPSSPWPEPLTPLETTGWAAANIYAWTQDSTAYCWVPVEFPEL